MVVVVVVVVAVVVVVVVVVKLLVAEITQLPLDVTETPLRAEAPVYLKMLNVIVEPEREPPAFGGTSMS